MLQTAARMGFSPQWMSSSVLSDTDIMYKISKGLFKDVIFATLVELPDSQHHLMVRYRKAHAMFAPKERWGVFFYAGLGFLEPMVEGLKRCGRNLTVENFVKAMESIKALDGIGGKVTFGPNVRQGVKACFLAKCGEGGKIERLTDWLIADLDVQEVLKRIRR
jgi:hypothetical protein